MSWFKLSDGFAFHRKALIAGNEAVGAWARAGAWSMAPDNLTDGYIPQEVADTIAPDKVWQRLERARLVERPADGRGGWQIHDHLDWNPSAAEIREKQEATRERVEQWRAKKKATRTAANGNALGSSHGNVVGNAVTADVPNASPNASRTLLPSRPVPSQEDLDQTPSAAPSKPRGSAREGAREGGGAVVKLPRPAPPMPEPSPEVAEILGELGRHEVIRKSAAAAPEGEIRTLRGSAEQIASKAVGGGKRVEWLVVAVRQAGESLAIEASGNGPPTWSTVAVRLRTFTDRARAPEGPDARASPGPRPGRPSSTLQPCPDDETMADQMQKTKVYQ